MNAADILHRSVGTFVASLGAAGVRHVCACPGARSTPLAIELARQSCIKLWMHLDERSAAYFGLGLARALREPVALLATSGTAAANFWPAVAEANLSRVPLVVLTADRPHELRDNGAAQTIDQLRLYGEHVRWFFDLPEPDGSEAQLHLLATLAARGVSTALREPSGPVQLNWPLREPLIPSDAVLPVVPVVRVSHPRLAPAPEVVRDLSAALRSTPRGIIVVGPQDDPELPASVAKLAKRAGYPVLGDALSGVRRGPHDRSLVIDTFDAFLRTTPPPTPDLVLRIGAIPTSKPLLQYLEHVERTIVVDPGGWREPTSLATDVLHVDPRLLCDSLDMSLPQSDWVSSWVHLNSHTRTVIDAHLSGVEDLFEGKVFSVLADLLPENALLYAGNSMPVRDLDTFLPSSPKRLRCLSNRGANGIDGVVSSALGASAGHTGRTVLVIGDISFYHDLNGLLAARNHDLDLLVVLLNNDGGGIFSFLPQADEAPDEFELLFGTPHGLDFRPFVEGYGGHFTRVDTWPDFTCAVAAALRGQGLHVVEVLTDRTRNVAQHRDVWRAVV